MKRCVLVIDDDLDTISFISLILEQDNYEVLATTNVEEGLAYFDTYQPAVLILDLEMPIIHGVQVLKKLKPGIDKDFSVIVLTGYAHDANIKICYELGAYAFLSKPVHLVELKGLVRNAMLWEEHKKLLQEHQIQLENLVQQRTYKLSQEIQHRKQTEQELITANQLKDKILNVLMLDLRPPLSNMMMNLRFLNEILQPGLGTESAESRPTLSGKEISRQINDVYDEARFSWQLAENIFQWARSKRGEILNQPELCNLRSILTDTVLYYSQTAALKQIKINSEIDAALEIYADRKIVYTIIHNLLYNAIKYSHQDGVITLTAQQTKNWVELAITDHGLGIPDELIPLLMDVTRPVSTPGTANEKGSGLGLVICHELAGVIDSKLTIDSKVGLGTTVTIAFPCSDVSIQEKAKTSD